LGWIHGICVFLSFLGLILFLFGVFLKCFGVSVVFYLGSFWSSWREIVNCGFWRTSGRFRGTFGVDLWLLCFSFLLGGDSCLVWCVFYVFWGVRWVLVGFMLVVMVKNCKLWVLENIR